MRNNDISELRKIANRIKELRKSSALTQEQLAEKANIDYKFFQKIETGKRNITVNTLIRICDSLNFKGPCPELFLLTCAFLDFR